MSERPPSARTRTSRALSIVAAALLLSGAAAASTLTLGCGPSGAAPKTANVQAGDLPDGAEWNGVYFSPLYGYLHILQDGPNVSGKWMRPVKDRWGELHGKITGDLIRFEWTERVIGLVGPNATRSGRGYFKYARPAGDNVDDTIAGQIGVGPNEVGEPWDAVKQRNMMPDLASIGGTTSGDLGGGDWDSENKEPGKPEPPAPPPP
jgi:hypothetical protein